jgi:chromosomal replication initiator protein
MGQPITLEIAQQRLRDVFVSPRQANMSIDNIQRVVAEYFSLSPNDLKGKKKTKNIVFPRQLAMYIAREITDYSTTELGQSFGGRDHATVIHSIDKIKGQLLTDSTLDSTIESLKRLIKEYSTI